MNREELLSKLSIRLTHLAESPDAKLNDLLDELRQALRSGGDATSLNRLSERLARRIILQEESSGAQVATAAGTIPADFANAIKSIKVDKAHRAQLSSLADKLVASNDLEQQLGILREVFQVVSTAASAAPQKKSSGGVLGLLGKKGGKDDGELDGFLEKSARLLDETVQHIDLLTGDASETRHVKDQLAQPASVELLSDALDEVIGMLHKQGAELEEERVMTQSFMGDLRRRLLNVEETIFSVISDGDESLGRAELLEQQVSDDVKILGKAAEEDDLSKLKQTLDTSLASLSEKMTAFLSVEKESHERSKQKVEDLNRKIKGMEEEASALRGQIKAKRDLALKDSLTGVYNRAGFEERVGEEFARRSRAGSALSLVFVDCNKFKQINDTYGHAAGDVVLVKVASTLSARARASDVVARYGGDEFVVLLPDTPLEGATLFAEDACKKVLEAGFNANGQPLDVSISCGVTTVRDEDTVESVLHRADGAMYEAKKMSGIRVVGVA